VKARLMGLDMKHQVASSYSNRPVLLNRTGKGTGADSTADDSTSSGSNTDDPGRPTLKRAPNSQ
jgi:hypothetical protein